MFIVQVLVFVPYESIQFRKFGNRGLLPVPTYTHPKCTGEWFSRESGCSHLILISLKQEALYHSRRKGKLTPSSFVFSGAVMLSNDAKICLPQWITRRENIINGIWDKGLKSYVFEWQQSTYDMHKGVGVWIKWSRMRLPNHYFSFVSEF